MSTRLVERGYLEGPLADAFARVDRARFVPSGLRAVASLDVPLPVLQGRSRAVSWSPRAAAIFLKALGVEPGHRVLLVARDGGYLAALASELAGARGSVVLATGGRATASAAGRRLAQAGYPAERVRAVVDAPWDEGPFDRILLAEEAAAIPTGAKASLAELGVLLARVPRADKLEVLRVLRAGDEFGDMHLAELEPARRPLGPGVEEGWPIRRLLTLEEAQRRVWTGRAGSAEEAEFLRAVSETWGPRFRTPLDPAKHLFHSGYVYLMAGDLETAEDCFRASLAIAPTAEAHTFLGWTWSFSGRFEEAIDACRVALALDPTFGNAYNDIGAYFLEMGRPEEALPWLERAIRAPRYSARVYPYANVARARLMSGDRDGAKVALEAALQVDPEYAPARELLRALENEDAADDADRRDGALA